MRAPWFFLRLRRFINHLLTYLLTYLLCVLTAHVHVCRCIQQQSRCWNSFVLMYSMAALAQYVSFSQNVGCGLSQEPVCFTLTTFHLRDIFSCGRLRTEMDEPRRVVVQSAPGMGLVIRLGIAISCIFGHGGPWLYWPLVCCAGQEPDQIWTSAP